MFFLQIFCFIFTTVSFAQETVAPARPIMDVADLQSLYDSGEVDEFLAHAKDVKPSIRGPKWRKMVTDFTKKKIEQLTNTKKVTLSDILKMEEIASYPFQKNDYDLQSKKLELGINFLTANFKNMELEDPQKLKDWWTNHWSSSLKLPTFAFRYAKLFEDQRAAIKNSATNLGIFFGGLDGLDEEIHQMLSIVYKSNLGPELCRDSWVWGFLWIDLKNFASELKKKDMQDFDMKMATTFSLNCWKSARTMLLNSLNQLTLEDRHLALHLLALDRSLEPMDRKFVQIYYLLNNPQPSVLMEESFDTLLKLSQDEKTRLELLKMFLALDPLIAASFADPFKEQAMDIIKKFTRSFPEYVDAYSQTCFDYIAGNKKFPQGNPTPDCLGFCRHFTKMDLTFFNKPIYKMIPYKFQGQCKK